jgi:hypothetical protein
MEYRQFRAASRIQPALRVAGIILMIGEGEKLP